MNRSLQAYLRLTRPPNLLTAVSDIWAGMALSGYFLLGDYTFRPVILLSLSSVLLYAGGVVMNDVFDAALDAVERPERPIPSGIISKRSAAVWGYSLLIIGIGLAVWHSPVCGILALLIALACLSYDGIAKPHAFWGPLNMGICRGLNLLLGMSVLSLPHFPAAWVAVTPVIYIAAVTLISRGEVHGGKRGTITAAMICYILVMVVIIGISERQDRLLDTFVFLLIFAGFVFPPLMKARRRPTGEQIGRAVKAGVLGLILMNASWAAAGAGWPCGVITGLLLPVSLWIAKKFAVT